MTDKIEFYGASMSGNCYKLQLLCGELDIAYVWHEMDIVAGAARTPEYLQLNPNGKVPLMVLQDGRCLPESNAILSYLADGSALAGSNSFGRADVLRWLFFEQYSHEPYIATSRFIIKALGNPADRQAELAANKPNGHKALAVMEQHLNGRDYFAGSQFTIADVALFAYTHVAPEGGFDLDQYAAVQNWIQRIQDRPGHVAMRSNGHE